MEKNRRIGWTDEELRFLYRQGSISPNFQKAVEKYFEKRDAAIKEISKKYPPHGVFGFGGMSVYP
jgi:hypothetical protein